MTNKEKALAYVKKQEERRAELEKDGVKVPLRVIETDAYLAGMLEQEWKSLETNVPEIGDTVLLSTAAGAVPPVVKIVPYIFTCEGAGQYRSEVYADPITGYKNQAFTYYLKIK